MKILVIASHAPSLSNFRGPLIAAMTQDGNNTVLGAAPNFDESSRAELRRFGGIPIHYPLSRAGLNPFADLLTLIHLLIICVREKPDLVLAYTIKPVVYGMIAARIAGIAQRAALITGLGYSFTGGDIKHRITGFIARILYRVSLRHAGVVFFQNPDDAHEFHILGLVNKQRTTVVNGSGVDLNHFVISPPVVDPPVFLLIARLIRDKGIAEFVSAARALKITHPHARFRIVGPFDPNPAAITPAEMEEWVREGVVEYLGETQDVRPHLAAASVFVLPSFYREGTPRTVLEALAMGRPAITTDMPGCRETVIPGYNGFLVAIHAVPQLIIAMDYFIRRPDQIAKMGRQGRKLAEVKYDVHAVNRVILARLGVTR